MSPNPYARMIHMARCFVDAWRIFPRLFLTVYIILLYKCVIWYMNLQCPNYGTKWVNQYRCWCGAGLVYTQEQVRRVNKNGIKRFNSRCSTIRSNGVGSALTGGGAAVADSSGTIPLLEDLRSISRENESNTERLTNVLRDMFAFDKTRFQRDRDQQREAAKEALKAPAGGEGGGMPSMEDMTGGFGAKGMFALVAFAFFAKEMGMNTDILKLPQQLKSMRAMGYLCKRHWYNWYIRFWS